MQINNQLIDEFIARTDWEAVWNEDTFSQSDTSALEKNLDYNKFDWMCGATKMVFQPTDPKEQYVIKIPFRFVGEEDWDSEDGDFYYNEIMYAPVPSKGIYESGFSGFNQYTWDYCQTELEYCKLAAAANISEFFPETIQYCEKPYPVYLQELCYPVFLKHRDDTNIVEERKRLEKILPEEIGYWAQIFSPFWIKDAIDYYGEDKLIKLFQFMSDFHMRDFHSSNYGYRQSDNTPVLIDFAGYYE